MVRAGTPPALAKDPWAFAAFAAAALLAARSWSPFVGEPVADDFDFLHEVFFGHGGWLDGGGSSFYWRPLARQLYYRMLGPTMLAHPMWIAALQVMLAACAVVLLYRALRPSWTGWQAASAASFVLVTEAARPLVSWPSAFQDLGAFLFGALSLHEASRARMPSALAALLAALLCKETALVVAVLLPWLPGTQGEPAGRRRRMLAVVLLVVIWGIGYGYVFRTHGLLFGRDANPGMPDHPASWIERWLWAAANIGRDTLGLTPLGMGLRRGLAAGLAALAAATLLVLLRDAGARSRLRASMPWVAWGATWFALVTALMAETHPDWRPYRGVVGGVGIGVAMAAALGAVRPALLGGLVAFRIATLALAPGPPSAISHEAPGGFLFDFAKLARLQRIVGETRRELSTTLPPPAPAAYVAAHYYPEASTYAFVGDRSLQVWYRDTTLHWMSLDRPAASRPRPATVLEFQATPPHQVVAISYQALQQLEAAAQAADRRDWDAALQAVARAESLERNPDARLFASLTSGKRALALGALGRSAEAESVAAHGLALWPGNNDARFALAYESMRLGRLGEAEAHLDTLLQSNPGEPTLEQLREEVRRARALSPGSR